MKAPISWLKDHTKIQTPTDKLMWRMTEVGMTTESFEEIEGEKILNVEVTPNRPDWLSIVGIAREIAVIENSKLKLPKTPDVPKPSKKLPVEVKDKSDKVLKYSAITIKGVKVRESPKWLQEKLRLMELRPINNLVDITNFVMWELGIPLHVFDYDKFKTKKLTIQLSKGGEKFTSVDDIEYELPKNTIIIKDKKNRVIDLAGIKGGKNTGITKSTKNIYIHVPIYDPVAIRKTSQKMKLASDASYIYERGPDLGGTLNTLKRTVDLTLELAGGKVASQVIDIKKEDYQPKKINVSIDKINQVLGIEIDTKKIIKILSSLHLSPKKDGKKITCTIPTFRSDLNIEEDLIEEIARIYGYNNFPTTLPEGKTAKEKIPFYYDRGLEIELKNLMAGAGFTETNTLALTSKSSLEKAQLDTDNAIKIANPVSLEYEYMRTSLIPSLIEAVNANKEEEEVKFFEYNKVYFPPVDDAEEIYKISAIATKSGYKALKGVVDLILDRLSIQEMDIKPTAVEKGMWHPVKSAVLEKKNKFIGTVGEIHPEVIQNFEIKDAAFAFELDVATLRELKQKNIYHPVPKYPPQIEDITLELASHTPVGDVIKTILNSHKHVVDVKLTDEYKKTFTFRVSFQHPEKTLKDKEVDKIRKRIFKAIKKETGASLKRDS